MVWIRNYFFHADCYSCWTNERFYLEQSWAVPFTKFMFYSTACATMTMEIFVYKVSENSNTAPLL